MESDHETGNSTRSVASATRMPSDATDDDEVRERGAFLELCFHCGRPNPVLTILYYSTAQRHGSTHTRVGVYMRDASGSARLRSDATPLNLSLIHI